jgi:hypothetical protein
MPSEASDQSMSMTGKMLWHDGMTRDARRSPCEITMSGPCWDIFHEPGYVPRLTILVCCP